MHLPEKLCKIFFGLFLMMISFSLAPNNLVADDATKCIRDEYQKLVDLLEADQGGELAASLSKWPDYVHKISTYSNREYLKAIDRLRVDYYEAVANYDQAVKTDRADRKKHTPEWFDTLVDRFGVEYVKNKKNAVLENIRLLFLKRNEYYYREISEKLFYKEAVLYGAYRYYFGLFLAYYQTLNQQDQILLKFRKDSVGAFLSLLNQNSMARLLVAESKPDHMLSVIRTESLDRELHSYFQTHPDIRYFDMLKASQELLKITAEQQ